MNKISYLNLISVILSILHGHKVTLPVPFSLPNLISASSEKSIQSQDFIELFELETNQPQLFTQN